MNTDEIATSIASQFITVWNAPIPFLTALIAIGGAIWWLIKREFETRLSNKNSQIELNAARVAEYERKLAGATPEEARERIESLEKRVAALQPRQRALSSEQQEAITRAVRSIDYAENKLSIIYPLPSPEAAIYAMDFSQALQRGGWNVAPDTVWGGGHRIMHHGITIAVPDLSSKSDIAIAVAEGLSGASLSFKWEEMPALNEKTRLCIDMIDRQSDLAASSCI